MPEMKDSGIEWIGEIPVDWDTLPLKNCFWISSGSTPDSNDTELWDGDIVWVTPADFKTRDYFVHKGKRNISKLGYKSCSVKMAPENSIIFSKRAPIGSVAINSIPLCTNQGCFTCIPRNQVNTKFYYYVMSIYEDVFNLYGSGTTFKEISATVFGNLKFQHPSLYEQRKIADFLDSKCAEIDALTADIEKEIEVLEEYKKSVITEAVTKGLDPNAEMKDSGIDGISTVPKDWNVSRLSYECYIRARLGWRGLKADEYVDEGYAFISAFNIQNGKLVWAPLNYITKERYDESPEIKIQIGDVLIVKDGAGVGKSARVDELPMGETAPNSSVAVITPNEELDYRYVSYYYS